MRRGLQGTGVLPNGSLIVAGPSPGVHGRWPSVARIVVHASAAVRAIAATCLVTGAVVAPRLVCAEPHYVLEIEAPPDLVGEIRNRTLLGRWQDDPSYDPSQLQVFVDRAQQEAEAIAKSAGYFSARALVVQRPPDTGESLPRIRIEVDAGARTTVNRFELQLDGVAEPGEREALLKQLRGRWPLGEGTFFRTGDWESGKRQMIELLKQRGYMRARVAASRAQVDPVSTTAGLSVGLDAGPRLVFGPMTVRGLGRYDRAIVEGMMPFAEGQPYAYDRLLLYETRLRSSGYFVSASAVPDLEAVDNDPGASAVPIVVEVNERRLQQTVYGLGYSSDYGARALLGYEHHDLFDRGWQFDSGLQLEQVRQRAYATVRTPFERSGHSYVYGVRFERLDVENEFTDKTTMFGGRVKRADEIDYFLSLQYQTEQRTIAIPGGEQSDNRQALTLGYSWNLRRLDNRVDPRRGYTVSSQISGAAKGLLTDRSFARLYTRAMRFLPMAEDSPLAGGMVVALGELGWVISNSRDDIPSENLFRAGGAQSVRGYRYQSLGVTEGNATVGGRVLAIGSLEYQHPIGRGFWGATFFDIGNVADRWVDYQTVRGYGAGVRWRSPIGPINVDIAYGGAERRLRAHIAVGYTF